MLDEPPFIVRSVHALLLVSTGLACVTSLVCAVLALPIVPRERAHAWRRFRQQVALAALWGDLNVGTRSVDITTASR